MKRKEHECRITNPHRDINGIVCLYIDGLRQSGKRTVRNGSTGSGGNTTADSNTGKLLYQKQQSDGSNEILEPVENLKQIPVEEK